jgi:sorting nexin-9/18/33
VGIERLGERPEPYCSISSTPDDSGEEEDAIQAKVAHEAEQHFVDTGPMWKHKLPGFQILVHSPSKRTSTLSGSYTVYTVTSVFMPPDNHDHQEQGQESAQSSKRISVHRRLYSSILPSPVDYRGLPHLLFRRSNMLADSASNS